MYRWALATCFWTGLVIHTPCWVIPFYFRLRLSMMAWFKDWFGTEYYRTLYSARNEDEAREWVEAILSRINLQDRARLLDMACGRGRHLYWFDQAGLRVTGIDLSPKSIEEASERVPAAELAVHDIRVPFAEERFDLVVSLFTSLGYFEDPADDHKVIEAAFAATKKHGHFVLDFMNANKAIAELVTKEKVERGGIEFNIEKEVQDDRIIKTVTVVDGEHTEQYQERVRAISAKELRDMVLEAGFIINNKTGGPDGSAFDPEHSDRLVIWAQKP